MVTCSSCAFKTPSAWRSTLPKKVASLPKPPKWTKAMKNWGRRGAVFGVRATRLTKRSRRVSCVAVKDSTTSCMRVRSGRRKLLNFRMQGAVIETTSYLGLRSIRAAWATSAESWARAWAWAEWPWINRSSLRRSRLVWWPREQELAPLLTVIISSKEILSVWSAYFPKTAKIPSPISRIITIRCHNLLASMKGEAKSLWSSASMMIARRKSLTFRETSNSRSALAVRHSPPMSSISSQNRWWCYKTLSTHRRRPPSKEGWKGRGRETSTRSRRSSTWRMKLPLKTIHSWTTAGHRRLLPM